MIVMLLWSLLFSGVGMSADDSRPKDLEHLKKTLTPLQYEVTCNEGTEPAFHNEYWDNKRDGIYVDRISGKPLFSSLDKYDSGTGWPSFTKPLEEEGVYTKTDKKLGMERVEVRSKSSNAHLGHVFDDGPGPTKKRFCMNSASLLFIPYEELEAKGLGQYKKLFNKEAQQLQSSSIQTAMFGGGCFWGVEDIVRKIPGVLETEVGYAGGQSKNPNYEEVKKGKSGHAEVVYVKFDSSKLSYEKLLQTFFRLHDPTTKNRQGNDVGTQYRSVIFAHDDYQKEIAAKVIKDVDQSKKWKAPIVTEVVGWTVFTKAEDYHQDYLQKNPNGYTCHFLRD